MSDAASLVALAIFFGVIGLGISIEVLARRWRNKQ